ncbi:MAG: class I SAM-dependent methyltransferase [Bacteroidales bacterium]|nr:class I SAM-dependent methyltransferase [Bacteroidales bacterium]
MNRWDERYNSDGYIYGIEPNKFLQSKLLELKPGKILFPGEGEGRNSVFAAKLEWETIAFDCSTVAKDKAMKLANRNNVKVEYQIAEYQDFEYQENYFDVIALIYTHIGSDYRREFHKKIQKFLKPSGQIIMEMFSKEQIHNNSGGPKSLDMLYSIEELKDDFTDMDILVLEKLKIDVSEGNWHKGFADVIRLVAKK